MMKKLSSTFRRKSSASPPTSPSDGAAISDPGLHELTNAYQRVLQEQNRQVDELRRLRMLTDNKPPLPGVRERARTFTAGSPSNKSENACPPNPADIPFFTGEENIPTPGVLPVRGRPAWQRGRSSKRKGRGGKPPRPGKSSGAPAPMPRRMVTAPSFEPTYTKLNYEENRTRQLSFSMEGSSRASDFSSESSPRLDRVKAGRRWKLPKKMSVNAPAPFAHLPLSSDALITQRRDRVEALPLAAACTYLESEMFRVRRQLDATRTDDDAQCCCRAHAAPLCECGHRLFLTQSLDRLRDILCILEDRYDNIEQYYVKGKEYAQAMGKFYQVSPSEYERWVEQRKPAGRSRSMAH